MEVRLLSVSRRGKSIAIAMLLAGGILCTSACSSKEIGEPTFSTEDWVYSNETIFSHVTVNFPYYSEIYEEENYTRWGFDEVTDVSGSSAFVDEGHKGFSLVSMYLGEEGGDSNYSSDPIEDYSSYFIHYLSRDIVYPSGGFLNRDLDSYKFTAKGSVKIEDENSVDLIYIDEAIPYYDSNGTEIGTLQVRGYMSKGYYSKFFGYIGDTLDNDTNAYLTRLFDEVFKTARITDSDSNNEM